MTFTDKHASLLQGNIYCKSKTFLIIQSPEINIFSFEMFLMHNLFDAKYGEDNILSVTIPHFIFVTKIGTLRIGS